MDEKKLMQAVQDLRAAFGDSQIDFAVRRLQIGYPTLQAYEKKRPPHGPALTKFVYLARECGRLDLAKMFKEVMMQDLGPELVNLLQVRGPEDEYKSEEKANTARPIDKRKLRA